VFVKRAESVIIQRTHDVRSEPLGQATAALLDIFSRSVQKIILFLNFTGCDSVPQISPFYMCMMLKIAVAAIVRASSAGQTDFIGYLRVGIFHPGIEDRQF
jgi:hypothetical protein